jgi:hypothetical protein
MYIPTSNRVNIMNIKNTMCKISGLTTEQKVNLVAEMPDHGFNDFRADEIYIGVTKAGSWGTWEQGCHTPKIVTYSEMMQLLTGKTVQFTKSDLKKGMFVRQRDGVYKVVFDNIICGEDGFTDLSSLKENLTYSNSATHLDIMDVYYANEFRAMKSYLQGLGLRRIWERTEQTEAQKEMEVLQAKMYELQEQMKVVKDKI